MAVNLFLIVILGIQATTATLMTIARSDTFSKVSLSEEFWESSNAEGQVNPMSKVECASFCLGKSLDVCNAFRYDKMTSNCTHGKLDFVPMPEPDPSSLETIVVYASQAIDRPVRNCLPASPCSLDQGICAFDQDCDVGYGCGLAESSFTCIRCNHSFVASRASGIMSGPKAPEYAMDGLVQEEGTYTMVTVSDPDQWAEFEFKCEVEVTRVYLTNANYNGMLTTDLTVSVRTNDQTIAEASVCGVISGSFDNGTMHELDCTAPLVGKFLIIQQLGSEEKLRLNEVLAFHSRYEMGQSIADQAVAVTASSLSIDIATNDPTLVIDKNFLTAFATDSGDTHPWIQFEFASDVKIIRLILTQWVGCQACADYFQSIGFYVGNNPATVGTLTTNPICNWFQGPPKTGQQESIECDNDVTGSYLIIQRNSTSTDPIGLAEIVIHGTFV